VTAPGAHTESSRARATEPTVRDVAERANVAISSASRVFTGHPNVSAKMRERVLSAANELGYQPDLIARSLRTGTSQTVGFLVADLANPIFAEVIRGAEDRLRSSGYGLLLTNSQGDPRLDVENVQLFLRRRVDGIMLLTADPGDVVAMDTLPPTSVPTIVLDRGMPRGSTASTVYFDHAEGFKTATRHLLRLGHKSIAFISGPPELRPVRDRLDGVLQAFQEAGVESDQRLRRLGSLAPSFGQSAMLELLDSDDPPTAVIVGGNRLLTGVLEALHARNRVVGTDIALISTDEVDLTRLYRPPISVVARDTNTMGRVAAELLLDRLADPTGPVRSVLLPTSFIARESSAVPPRS
jgi:LacI family transcriptional regulator